MKKTLLLSALGLFVASSAFAEITIKDVKNTSSSINYSKIKQGYIDQALLAGTGENASSNGNVVPSFGSIMKDDKPKAKQLDVPNDFFIKEEGKNKTIPPIKL